MNLFEKRDVRYDCSDIAGIINPEKMWSGQKAGYRRRYRLTLNRKEILREQMKIYTFNTKKITK